MKRGFLIFGILIAFLTACQDDTVAPGPDPTNPTAEKSTAVKEALKVMSSLQAMERLGFGSPTLFNSAVGFQASSGGDLSSARSLVLTTARMANDTTDNGGGDGGDDHGDDCGWTSCASEEFIDNGDGSYTWIIDYGEEGCEEYGYFMKGKMVETFSENDGTFSSKIEYTNFGDEYYTQNGTSEYTGTWESSGNEEDSTSWTYAGSYAHKEDLTISINDEDFNETFTYQAEGSENFDENGFTSNEGFMKYTASNGDFYNTVIQTPLFYSYNCESDDPDKWVFVYVSGVEATNYQEGDVVGEFSVNYGDGTCDNIITITENGESYDVDLGEQWEDDWEDDDTNG